MIFNTFNSLSSDSLTPEEMVAARKDTLKHIETVAMFLQEVSIELNERGRVHDASKMESPEFEGFAKATARLKTLTYGSDEYAAALSDMKPTIDHHYAHNSHHPEYYERGIDGMDLFDVIEMICDWKAAAMRHDDGDVIKSMEINKKRFNISDQLYSILMNTLARFPNRAN